MIEKKLKSTRFRKQLLSWLGIGVFLLLILSSLMRPSLTVPPPKETEKPDFMFEGVTISFYDNETLTWQVRAASAEIYDSKDQVILKNAVGNFVQSETTSFQFESPNSILHFKNPIMRLQEAKAMVISAEGNISIYSQLLEWNRDKETIKGRGLTRVKKDKITLEGEIFDVRLPLKKMTMAKNSRIIVEE